MSKRLGPITPGRILKEEFLKPLKMPAENLAKKLAVGIDVVNGILDGSVSIKEDLAKKLSQCFGTSDKFWLNLQELHDQDIKKK